VNKPISKRVSERLKTVEYFLLDEFYLIGINFLQFINKTLQKIKNTYTPFGNVSFIAFGDCQQLSCIGDKPFYSNFERLDDNCKNGLNIYRSFESYTLKENKRVTDDFRFKKLLRHLRYKRINLEDIQLLRSRLFSNVIDQERQRFVDEISIYPTNFQAEECNKIKLIQLGKPVLKLETIQTPSLPRVVDDFDLYISEGCRIFLTRNLLTSFGLVNGRCGSVTKICFNKDQLLYPAVIFVKFDNWEHSTCFFDSVPIFTVRETIFDPITKKNFKIERFPLRCCYGVTLHRIQGSQFKRCNITFGAFEPYSNYGYTLLSRVSSLKDILILDRFIDINRFSNNSPSFVRDFETQKIELIRLGVAQKQDLEDSDAEPEDKSIVLNGFNDFINMPYSGSC
jgi:hypothetical protein